MDGSNSCARSTKADLKVAMCFLLLVIFSLLLVSGCRDEEGIAYAQDVIRDYDIMVDAFREFGLHNNSPRAFELCSEIKISNAECYLMVIEGMMFRNQSVDKEMCNKVFSKIDSRYDYVKEVGGYSVSEKYIPWPYYINDYYYIHRAIVLFTKEDDIIVTTAYNGKEKKKTIKVIMRLKEKYPYWNNLREYCNRLVSGKEKLPERDL